jgi:hypothetical protein
LSAAAAAVDILGRHGRLLHRRLGVIDRAAVGDVALGEVERLIQRDTGRNIGPVAACAAGGLQAAAEELSAVPDAAVAIVTGFFIAGAPSPAAETDGPPGAALLAEQLRDAGTPASLITDGRCAPVVRAVAQAAGVPLRIADGDAPIDALIADLRRERVTHVIFVERAGPARDGETYNMLAEPISQCTAPLHRLALEPAWRTIGVGDGGNEVGMGSVPPQVVAHAVDHGAVIHCTVPCDALVVSAVSNWGAIALGAAVAMLRRPGDPVPVTSLAERHEALLGAALAGGAVDGTTGEPSRSVDGLALAEHSALLLQVAAELERARAARRMP